MTNSLWSTVHGRVEAMNLRTRAIALLTTLSALVFMWDLLANQPLDLRRQQLQDKAALLKDDLQTLNAETQRYLAAHKLDPDASRRDELRQLRRRANGSRTELAELMAGLVPPHEVPRVLEHMLHRHNGLSLIRLEGLGPEPVTLSDAQDAAGVKGSAKAGAAPDDTPARLFSHGMRVTFEGGYLAALAYLSALENSAWKLFWEAVEVEVKEHPRSQVSITVFSLSTDEAWIGV